MHVKSFSPVAALSLRSAAVVPQRRLPAAASERTIASMIEKPAVALLVFLLAVLAAYAPALGGGFLWDDNALVKGNLLIRSPLFSLEVFRHTLFDGSSNFYRPIQTLSFIADYWFCGLNPFGYHLTSILLHAVNAWLLFLVLRRVLPALLPTENSAANPDRTGRIAAMAFAVALIWCLHPVHSAAVAYISGSADSLAMGCCLTAWLFCEKSFSAVSRLPRLGYAAGAFIFLLCGLCSKEIAAIWLALFAMYLFGVRRNPTLRIKFAVIAGGLAALAIYVVLRSLPPSPPAPPPYPVMPSRWLLMIRALGDYGSLMLFPVRLFMERQVFAAPGLANPEDDSVYLSMGIAGVLMLVLFLGGALRPGRGQLLRRFGAGWFLLAFLPISNLFTLNASVAEHWLYLPSIGFLLFLTGVAVELPSRRIPRLAIWTTGAVLLIAGALGIRTHTRCFDWLDELSFFRQTIQDGGDVPRARLGLANSYSHLQDNAAAIPLLRRMTAQYPHLILAKINLATVLAKQNQPDEAKSLFEQVLDDPAMGADPRLIISVIANLDRLENSPAWTQRRQSLLDNGMKRHPNSWELVQLQLQDDERARALDKALTTASRFADSHWWHSPARYTVGCVQSELGRDRDALASFTRAAKLDVYDVQSLNAATEVSLSAQRLDDARRFQDRAVRRQPDSPRQRMLLAQVMERQGDLAGSTAQLAIADHLLKQTAASAAR